MKVYLVNPPGPNNIKMVREGRCMQRKGAWTTVWPPVTLATIAAMLLEKGFEVKLSDCIVEDIDINALIANIVSFDPDILLINTATASILSDLSVVRLAKRIKPDIKTVVIGIHVTALPDESFKLASDLDFLIRGEPEFCFLELALALRDGGDALAIKGLSFMKDNFLQHNLERGFEEDLNRLPFPAWHLIDPKNYLLPFVGEPFLLITTSKGCPHRCIFCPAKPYYGGEIRFRNVENVIGEIEYVVNEIKVRNFLIWAESFADEDDFVYTFCEGLRKRNLKVRWTCNARVDKVNLDKLKKMREMGCWMIGFGIESGCQGVLNQARKGTTLAQIKDAVRLAKEAGLEVTGHIVFGLPGETWQTGLETIRFIKGLDLDFLQCYCAVPWPSTELYWIAKQKGWLITKDWSLYEQNHSVLNLPTITAKEVEALRKKAFLEFYLSPSVIFKTIKKIRSFKMARNLLKMVKEFLDWL